VLVNLLSILLLFLARYGPTDYDNGYGYAHIATHSRNESGLFRMLHMQEFGIRSILSFNGHINIFQVENEVDRGRIEEPTVCANCNNAHCFQLIHNRSMFMDKQIIKLQESPGKYLDKSGWI
jgi:hypothetical protein